MGGTMKILNIILFLLALTVMSNLVAAEFKYEITPINDSIFNTELGSYRLTIYNLGGADTFQLATSSARWIIDTQPKMESVTLPAGEQSTFTVLVDPKMSVGIGPFGVPVKLKSLKTGEFVEFNIPINIKEMSEGDYVPSVALGVEIEKKVDPRDRISVNILLRNRNALSIDNLVIAVDGVIFRKQYTTTLGGLEEKGQELLFTVDKLEQPRSYVLNVQILYNDKLISESTRNFEIIAYDNDVKKSEVTSSFFKATKTITMTNDGNYLKDMVWKEETSALPRLFTKTDPKAKLIRENGANYYSWSIPVKSQESTQITVTTNYRLLVIIIIIVILAIIAYYVFRSPIIVMKDALIDDMKEDLSELKIRIFVKNRSRKTINNIKVIDRVPGIAEFLKGTALGTIKPTKIIKSSKKGTIVRWDIETLEPYEERIITYKIKSRLKIIGGMRLPAAGVRFDTRTGVQRASLSNEINVIKRMKRE